MENTIQSFAVPRKARYAAYDVLALSFIYFVPALSHLFSFPVYYIEPMRIALILALVHTSKKNAYLIALTLPVFSFLVSAHPTILKTGLITVELLFNVWLFFSLTKLFKNNFVPLFLSIALSKAAYYFLKFGLIQFALMESGLISTPLYMQLIVTFVLSLYVWLILDVKKQPGTDS